MAKKRKSTINNTRIFDDLLLKLTHVDAVFTPSFMKKFAASIKEQIVRRTRIGKGLTAQINGELKKMPPLTSEAYIEQREDAFNLSSKTKPNKSNVTATGQLLDSLTSSVSGTTSIIQTTENRLDTLSGKGEVNVDNSDLVGHLADQGRIFLGLAKTEKQRKVRQAMKFFTAEIKKRNKKK